MRFKFTAGLTSVRCRLQHCIDHADKYSKADRLTRLSSLRSSAADRQSVKLDYVGGEISGSTGHILGRVGEILWTRRRNTLDASAKYFGRVGGVLVASAAQYWSAQKCTDFTTFWTPWHKALIATRNQDRKILPQPPQETVCSVGWVLDGLAPYIFLFSTDSTSGFEDRGGLVICIKILVLDYYADLKNKNGNVISNQQTPPS